MLNLTVSIIVCTHNRAKMLDEALTSLLKVIYPAEACEIVIVDNASQDETRRVVGRYKKQAHSRVRYIYEGKLGLSNARNTGARLANNEIIVYVDDDEYFETNWLQELLEPFKENVVCCGGQIDLYWENKRPEWMPDKLESYLGSNHHLGDVLRYLGEGEYPFGGNIAIRRELLLKVGGFDTRFGRSGTTLGTNEEARLADLLRPLGKIAYNPKALVHHRISAKRARQGYLLRLGYHQGIGDVRLMNARQSFTRNKYFRLAIIDLRFLIIFFLRFVKGLIRLNQKTMFEAVFLIVTQFGHLHECVVCAISKR